MGCELCSSRSNCSGGPKVGRASKKDGRESGAERRVIGGEPGSDTECGFGVENELGCASKDRRQLEFANPNNAEKPELTFDPRETREGLECDLRRWRNLYLINPPALRNKVAIDWLSRNQGKCLYGQIVYIRNTMPRVLGTAHTTEIETLSWALLKEGAKQTQALTTKREI